MAASKSGETRGWRRLYTDASILLAYVDTLELSSTQDGALALSAISHLDHAIVIAGAPGEGRLDCILDMIASIQSAYLGAPSSARINVARDTPAPRALKSVLPRLSSSTAPVPRLDRPPSLAAFVSRHSRQPFVLPGFLLDWPALNEHPWCSLEYLRAVAGPGRVVPVEVGSDYRRDDWTQKMMPWTEFLSALDTVPAHTPGGESAPPRDASKPVLYLAQHSLFTQFPALKDDVIVPDYVYTDLDPPADYPQYAPPANEDRLVLNAWLGPAGTISPAHTVRLSTHICMRWR